jgi:septum formation protein
MRVILASNSPRRSKILREHGVSPTIMLPSVNESLSDEERALPPARIVELLALRKARDVYQRLVDGSAFCATCRIPYRGLPALIEDALIVAADTVVVKGDILGKPASRDEAIAMLQLLCATTHEVYTGVAFVRAATGEEWAVHEVSRVRFGAYSLKDIEEFIEAEPPYDKAGSYALQGMWAKHVERVEGDIENVIGLPWRAIEPYLST